MNSSLISRIDKNGQRPIFCSLDRDSRVPNMFGIILCIVVKSKNKIHQKHLKST